MIRFGPSGIPLSCKGRTQKDGLEDVHTLGLNAMEIQFVRVNVFQRFVMEEEIGLHPTEIEGEYIVDVVRKSGKKKPRSVFTNKNLKLKRGDKLVVLISGVADDYKELSEIGKLAKDLDIQLALHTPYYMDLLGSQEQIDNSMKNLRLSGLLARDVGAEIIVTHLGMYDAFSKKEALDTMLVRMKNIEKMFDAHKIKCKLGIEITGKQAIFGDLDEVLEMCKEFKNIVPVINFAHLHARSEGLLKKKEDFENIFELTKKFTKSNKFYTHFSGVEHEGGNEKRYTPIKKGDLKFEPLAECVLDNDYEVTIISGSPLLEHDAMYMKVILERVQLKKEIKATKLEKAAEKKRKEEKKKAKSKKKGGKKKGGKKKGGKKKGGKKKGGKKKGGKKKSTSKKKGGKKKSTSKKKGGKKKSTSKKKGGGKKKSTSKKKGGKKKSTSKKKGGKKKTSSKRSKGKKK